MKTKVRNLALVLGTLALASSCANGSTSNTQTQQSQKVIEVSNAVTTETKIKIDGSSTVYPITQAIAKEFQADSNNKVQVYRFLHQKCTQSRSFCGLHTFTR
ncbi:hypothetical protein LC593_00205 [Nostoc sp. CHAB 5844]|nr:hypothetical protein [Nostoc sp. CHAB 5844]